MAYRRRPPRYSSRWKKMGQAEKKMDGQHCRDTGYLYSCREPVREWGKTWKISPSSLTTPQALNSADPDQMIQGLHSSFAKLTAPFSVSLQWVPAHVGLTGNGTADRLAKIGSQAPQTHNPITYREANTLLHHRYNGDLKKYNGGYQAHLDPLWRLGWAQQITIFRLRTGHCGLSAHLKRTGISDTFLCECGQADQTTDHVLHSCPIYTERRQQAWPRVLIWRPSCGARQKTSTGRVDLWHQPDWRSDLHGCPSSKKNKIAEWTGNNFATTQTLAHVRQRWRQLVQRSSVQRRKGLTFCWRSKSSCVTLLVSSS